MSATDCGYCTKDPPTNKSRCGAVCRSTKMRCNRLSIDSSQYCQQHSGLCNESYVTYKQKCSAAKQLGCVMSKKVPEIIQKINKNQLTEQETVLFVNDFKQQAISNPEQAVRFRDSLLSCILGREMHRRDCYQYTKQNKEDTSHQFLVKQLRDLHTRLSKIKIQLPVVAKAVEVSVGPVFGNANDLNAATQVFFDDRYDLTPKSSKAKPKAPPRKKKRANLSSTATATGAGTATTATATAKESVSQKELDTLLDELQMMNFDFPISKEVTDTIRKNKWETILDSNAMDFETFIINHQRSYKDEDYIMCPMCSLTPDPKHTNFPMYSTVPACSTKSIALHPSLNKSVFVCSKPLEKMKFKVPVLEITFPPEFLTLAESFSTLFNDIVNNVTLYTKLYPTLIGAYESAETSKFVVLFMLYNIVSVKRFKIMNYNLGVLVQQKKMDSIKLEVMLQQIEKEYPTQLNSIYKQTLSLSKFFKSQGLRLGLMPFAFMFLYALPAYVEIHYLYAPEYFKLALAEFPK